MSNRPPRRSIGWTIAPHLAVRGAVTVALLEWPVVRPDGGPALRLRTTQIVEPAEPLYRGRTFTLVDGRAIRHAEHSGLFLEAAAGTTVDAQEADARANHGAAAAQP